MNKRLVPLMVLLAVMVQLIADRTIPLGDGTEDNPYRIENWDNIDWLSSNINIWSNESHFIQTSDIDASEAPTIGFVPIGSWAAPFNGIYDGNGYCISNLTIQYGNVVGLFGVVNEGSIKNLTMDNIDFSSDASGNSGGLVAFLQNSQIEKCHVTGQITADYYCGGLVASASMNSTISRCSSKVSVAGNFYACGGLIGHCADSIVSDCYYNGDLNNSTGLCAGIVGICNPQATIINSYAFITDNSIDAYALTALNEGSITNCVWCIENAIEGAFPATSIGTATNVISCSVSEMQIEDTYLTLTWDFVDVWEIDMIDNNGFPYHIPYVPVLDNEDLLQPLADTISSYPNPFNSCSTISIKTNKPSTISIYNIKGQLVKTFQIKTKSFEWDGTSDAGNTCGAGIYFIKSSSGTHQIKKVVMLR